MVAVNYHIQIVTIFGIKSSRKMQSSYWLELPANMLNNIQELH
ncbi:MAG TPA: hypothetical protein VFV86_08635 [Nitrososphaeraceae archaeon]|nr:hypothetical protein [Nitrososphaeraceae archaeon]